MNLESGVSDWGTKLMSIEQVNRLRERFHDRCKQTENRYQNFQIRIHRALSWFERAIELNAEGQPDGRLLYCWIAFNSLYGTWDPIEGFPAKDTLSWKSFLDSVSGIDDEGRIGQLLGELRPDVMWLLENKFLDPRYWKDTHRPGNVRARYFKAQSLYVEKRWSPLLDYVVERIYVLRGQIAHGAATRGSQLNRETLSRCRGLLESILMVVLDLVIDHRADDDWPPLCYPPMWDD